MTVTHTGDLHIHGALFAGNIVQGAASIFNEGEDEGGEEISPLSVEVTGLNVQGNSSTVQAFVTASTLTAGHRVKEVSAFNVSHEGLTIFMFNTNKSPRRIYWMLIRN